MTKKDLDLLKYLQQYLTPQRYERLEEVLSFRTRHFTVVLEDVYQDRNEGAIMRSCDCFGIQDIHMVDSRSIRKVTHAIARGAEKWITQYRYDESDSDPTGKCLTQLREKGYRIVATTPHKKGVSIDQFCLDQSAAFVFGTEDTGISNRMIEEADEFVYIPMVGFTESFNVSVAAAMLLQDLTLKLRNSSIPWQLTEVEKNLLRLEWTKKSIKYLDSLLIDFEKKYNHST